MRTKYHCSRSLLAGFLAVVMLVSLVPAASAAQQNSYHDPAEHWQEANNRTNELDANAVIIPIGQWFIYIFMKELQARKQKSALLS